MSKYNSCRDLAFKMDNEGGLAEFAFGYGLSEDELPEDISPVMLRKLLSFLDMRETYEEIQAYIYDRMDDDPKPGDWDYEEE